MELKELEQQFVKANTDLGFSRNTLYDASERVISSRQAIETRRAELINSGTIDGKNEEQRKAQLSERMADILDELRENEAEERQARRELDEAQANFDLLRYRLRIAELMYAPHN